MAKKRFVLAIQPSETFKHKHSVAFAMLLLMGIFSAACTLVLPNTTNASSTVTAVVTPNGTYDYLWYNNYGATQQALSSNASFAVPSNYSFTRVYAKANSSSDACNSSTLIFTLSQQTVSNDLFAKNILDWFNSYSTLILGIFSIGIAYAVTLKLGHACLSAGVMWVALYIMLLNPLFMYGAISIIILGLILTYANI